jgi:hypothetical protein
MFIVAVSGSVSGSHGGHQKETGGRGSLDLFAKLRLKDMETV